MKAEIDSLIAKHGHAAIVEHLAAIVGWQGRHYPMNQAQQIAKVAKMLAESAAILEQIEAEEVGAK